MTINQIASAVLNDLYAGNLIKTADTSYISIEQLEDEVADARAAVLKEWYLKGILQLQDIAVAINCIEVDCKDQNKCECMSELANAKMAKHFEIPQLMPGLGSDSILFVGSTDRSTSFKVYYNLQTTKYNRYYERYKRKKSLKPYVYIEKTLNENNMYDGWIFNAPLVKYIAVIGIFRDPRQLEQFNCCHEIDYLEMGAISNEVLNRVLDKKVRLYRVPAPFATPTV